MAPNQSIITNVDSVKMSKDGVESITFNIEYLSKTKLYKEQYKVHYQADRDNIQGRANTKGNELKIISYTLQDLVEKLL